MRGIRNGVADAMAAGLSNVVFCAANVNLISLFRSCKVFRCGVDVNLYARRFKCEHHHLYHFFA